MPINIIGDTYGRLTVISLHSNLNYRKKFLCKCSCGKSTIVTMSHLRAGHTTSCGCKLLEPTNLKHNESKTKLYKVYYTMLSRCHTPSASGYYKYGAKGISVCNEWKNSYIAFAAWAKSNGYKEGLTIDRIFNNKNYSPNNCRWVTALTQAHNKPKIASNTSGIKNIHFNKSKNKWVVRFTYKGERTEFLCTSLDEAKITKQKYLTTCTNQDILDGAKYA